MSYLNLPRLVFTGDFKSDVSTVNNDPAHYNNATFESSFQIPQDPTQPPPNNGWWNPEGGATFDFVNCKVQQITLPDGSTPADDLIVGCKVGSPNDRSGGKMVDLDSQAQMVSQLWAVTLTISDSDGNLLLQGNIKPTGFRDLQMRQTAGASVNGQPRGGTWTSVLTNIEWGEKAESSEFLTTLRKITQGDRLSLNLNAFGYYYNHAPDGRFSLGRIIGSIGPWFEGEPDLFAPARRLYGILSVVGRTYFNFTNFLLDAENRRLTFDFGSSFPVSDSLGSISKTVIPAPWIFTSPQKFIIAAIKTNVAYSTDRVPQVFGNGEFIQIGELDFQTGQDWLNESGGIVEFDNLSQGLVNFIQGQQLILLSPSANFHDQYVLVAREAINGYVIRADDNVQRLDCNQTNDINIYAYQWGAPLGSQNIFITLEDPTPELPVNDPNGSPICETPGNGYPPDGIGFLKSVQTDANGRAVLEITGNAIYNPRKYIDGQIYYLDYELQNIPTDPMANSMIPDNISIHLRDYFELPENPAWSDIAEIMTQYSNLYPIMSKYIVDLSNPVAVKAKKNILMFAFTRDITDPLHMPVTRDLSETKRQAILKWLESDELNLGEKIPPVEMALSSSSAAPAVEPTEKQIKLIRLTRLKGGAEVLSDDAENTLEN